MKVYLEPGNDSIFENYLGCFKYKLSGWIGEILDLHIFSEIVNEEIKISITSLSFRDVCLLKTMTKTERLELNGLIKIFEKNTNSNWRSSGGLRRLKLQNIEDEIERLERLQDEEGIGFDEEEIRKKLMIEYDLIEEDEDKDNTDFDLNNCFTFVKNAGGYDEDFCDPLWK